MPDILEMILWAVASGLLAQTLSAIELRRIRRKEGVMSEGNLIRFLDFSIITLASLLIQICFLNQPDVVRTLAGVAGAFLAASAWCDAKTGWVPDSVIVPALVIGLISAWANHHGQTPELITALAVGLTGLAVFGALIFAYLRFERMRITPPDATFALLIVLTPTDLPQMVVVLLVLIVAILFVRWRPDLVRALIPQEERNRLTDQMEEVLGMEGGEMNERGWFPLGPIALVCILAGHCANALM